jgi:quercetin dioxygenase-like cupin family protein
MKVSKYNDTKPTEELRGVLKREVITARDGALNFCMRVFEVEPGSATPDHSHPWEHEVFILSGRGVVKSKTGETEISAGSVVFIAPGEPHCFTNTGKQVLRFICLIPIQDQGGAV